MNPQKWRIEDPLFTGHWLIRQCQYSLKKCGTVSQFVCSWTMLVSVGQLSSLWEE